MFRKFTRPTFIVASLSISFAAYADPLKVDSLQSLRAVTPGAENHYLRHVDGVTSMAGIAANGERLVKEDATFRVVRGLADGNCYSFESSNFPGHYLRHRDFRLRKDFFDRSDIFRNDATFCARPALDGSGNISLESKNMPGYYLRHRNGEVWMEDADDNALFRKDATWRPVSGLWKSEVRLATFNNVSLRVARPGFTNRYIRHYEGLAFTEPVSGDSPLVLKRDATFRIVPGLAENTCYSFESTNYPGHYLRHSAFRIRKDQNDGSKVFKDDATFCAQRGLSGYGISFRSYNFPSGYIRHASSQLWLSTAGEGGFAEDASWDIAPGW